MIRDTGIRLRCYSDRIDLAIPQYRRWWQFWRPKVSMQILAEVPHQGRAGDRICLMATPCPILYEPCYSVIVNDKPVLRYPPHEHQGGS